MVSPNFESVLDKPAEAIERPKPKPAGWYQAVVQGVPSLDTRTVQGEDKQICGFKLKVISAHDPDEDMSEALSDPLVGEIPNWPPQSKDFWYEADGAFGLKQFVSETLGVDLSGKSLRQALSETPGKHLLVELIHKPYLNKTTNEMDIATNVGKTAKL